MPLNALMTALPSVREAEIDVWVDLGILCRHAVPSVGGNVEVVELAFPVDAVACFASNTVEPLAYNRLFNSHEMVHGTDGSTSYLYETPESQFEALMRPRVNRLLPVPLSAPAACDSEYLNIHANALLYMHTKACPSGVCLTVSEETGSQLAARTWRLERDAGLDAVQFEWDETSSTLNIHGWRCLGGRATSTLAGGDLIVQWDKLRSAAQAQAEKHTAACASHDVAGAAPPVTPDAIDFGEAVEEYDAGESATLSSIMLMAAVSFSRLALALLRSQPDPETARLTVNIGTFVLTSSMTEGTTKPASTLAHASPPWEPPSADHALLGFTAAQWEQCTWTFRTMLYLGVDWIVECLEPELRLLWVRPYMQLRAAPSALAIVTGTDSASAQALAWGDASGESEGLAATTAARGTGTGTCSGDAT